MAELMKLFPNQAETGAQEQGERFLPTRPRSVLLAAPYEPRCQLDKLEVRGSSP